MEILINSIKKYFAFINQPFPEETDLFSVIKQGAIVGIFIFLFLKFVQPFDMEEAGSKITLYAFYFGVVTFLVTILYDVFLIYILKVKINESNWTFLKWIFSVLGLLFFISVANCYLMTVINQYASFTWPYLLNAFYVTSIVGIFPTVFFGALKVNRYKTLNEKIAESVEIDLKEKQVDSDNLKIDLNNETLDVQSSDFIFAQSMQNYVTIYIENSDTKDFEKKVVRSTLTALANQIVSEQILQVHRSYIVNKEKIERVTGNAQGLKLHLIHSEIIVPVSRKYIPLFRK